MIPCSGRAFLDCAKNGRGDAESEGGSEARYGLKEAAGDGLIGRGHIGGDVHLLKKSVVGRSKRAQCAHIGNVELQIGAPDHYTEGWKDKRPVVVLGAV